MIDFLRNNLDHSTSPYLRQHKKNPIFWQEWNKETLEYAKRSGKLIFVSIGYATCRWCHVMAKEAFSNPEIAKLLNENFVSIKIDREQRPDLDQYFIEYVTETQNQAGWPLNIFLSPDQIPFFGGTYFPDTPKYGLPSFKYVIEEALHWYSQNKNQLQDFTLNYAQKLSASFNESDLFDLIENEFDIEWAGFQGEHKFPPHNTLLYLLYNYPKTQDKNMRSLIINTLESMAQYGLHDHLQGGFYRYCTDKTWIIPHFEKMLYDQAMHLWVYSAAYKVFQKPTYKIIVEKLIQCLEETFEHNGLYFTALDAEVNEKEGETYLWSEKELKKVLKPKEFEKFSDLYVIVPEGNFENKNHLVKNEEEFLPSIEEKLLKIRKKRPQPSVDKKIITSWNALTGIGFIMAYRYAGIEKGIKKAKMVFEKLIEKHYKDEHLYHSSLDNTLQREEFLEDYASLLLLTTYLEEEIGGYKNFIEELSESMNSFYEDGVWYTNIKTKDFQKIPAKLYDHPIPSPVSLAEFARVRTNFLLQKYSEIPLPFHEPLEKDFYNIVASFSQGGWHEIKSPEKLNWKDLPLNSIQQKGASFESCFLQKCQSFKKKEDFLEYLKSYTCERADY